MLTTQESNKKFMLFTLFFAVSNEVPEHPVVSPVSGSVFERRLIEKYIADNGVDPVNGKELTVEQLVEIKSNRIFQISLLWYSKVFFCYCSTCHCKAKSSISNKYSSSVKISTGWMGCCNAEFIYFKAAAANSSPRTKVGLWLTCAAMERLSNFLLI